PRTGAQHPTPRWGHGNAPPPATADTTAEQDHAAYPGLLNRDPDLVPDHETHGHLSLPDHPLQAPRRPDRTEAHPREPEEADASIEVAGSRQPPLHQSPSGLLLLIRFEPFDGLLRRLLVDPATLQLVGQRPLGQAPPVMPRLDPSLSERLIVDEPQLGEPVEHRLRHLVGHIPLPHRLGQLRPRLGRHREQPQADGPRHRLRIGRRRRSSPGIRVRPIGEPPTPALPPGPPPLTPLPRPLPRLNPRRSPEPGLPT